MSGAGRLRRGAALLAVCALLAGCSGGTPSEPTASTATPDHRSPDHRSPDAGSPAPRAAGPGSPGAVGQTPARHLTVQALTWRLPVPLAREAVVADPRGGHRVVVAGGLVAGDLSSSSAYSLDLRSGRAMKLPDLPVAVHDVAGAAVDRQVLVVGGGNAAEQDVVQRLDAHRTWQQDPPLPQPRSDLSSVSVHARLLVVGGYDGTTPAIGAVLERRPQGDWRVLGTLPVPVRYAAVAVCNGAVWVFGGERDGAMVDTVQRIDPDSGRARVTGRLPRALGHASAATFGDRVLLMGGRTGPERLTGTMWWFDPTEGTFTRAGALPTPLADSAVVTDAGSAYLVGGETPAFSARVVRLSPAR